MTDKEIPQPPPLKVEPTEFELPNKPIIPAIYPDSHDQKSNISISSDVNVKESKDWVDHNIK